jgi:hypothetical protein
MNELEKILEKYFGDDRIKYYMTADVISNDQFIRWAYCKHERQRIVISIGSNDGEVEVKIFTDAEQLEQFIKLIIF